MLVCSKACAICDVFVVTLNVLYVVSASVCSIYINVFGCMCEYFHVFYSGICRMNVCIYVCVCVCV